MPLTSGDAGWFQNEFGFDEGAGKTKFKVVRSQFVLNEENGQISLTSSANGRSFHVGAFSTPSVADLRCVNVCHTLVLIEE